MTFPVPRRPLLAVLPGLGLAALPAAAQEAPWRPDRTVTVVVPFAAGSGTDVVARTIVPLMAEEIGATMVVENRPGANGAIAATAVARARPDGQTVLLTTNTTHSANPVLLRRLDYDPIRDFAPVTRIGHATFVFLVGRHVPARSMTEFLAWARAKPGGITYASANSIGVVGPANLARLGGFEATNVPYRAAPQALTDAIAGRVDCIMIDIVASLGHVREGTLLPIAVLLPERTALLPATPTMREAGFTTFDLPAWTGVFLPAAAPERIVRTLGQATLRVIGRPAVRERLAEYGCEVAAQDSAVFRDYVGTALARWAEMVRAAGIEPE